MVTTEALCASVHRVESIDLEGKLVLLRSLRGAAAASSSEALLITQNALPDLIKYVMEAERSTEDKTNDSTSDPVIEWMQLLICRLAEQNHLGTFFSRLSTQAILSQEQIITLHLYTALLDDTSSSSAAITTSLPALVPLLISKLQQLTPTEEFLSVAHVLSAALTRCLDDVNLRNSIVAGDIVSYLCKVLFELKKKSTSELLEEVEKEVVKASLQMLYNLLYHSRAAQDALLACEGLPVILTHCGTDFSNPLTREWALLCIRNACDGNDDVKAYIEQLQPQGVIQDEEMAARGLRVELDATTGKFVFKQENANDTSTS